MVPRIHRGWWTTKLRLPLRTGGTLLPLLCLKGRGVIDGPGRCFFGKVACKSWALMLRSVEEVALGLQRWV